MMRIKSTLECDVSGRKRDDEQSTKWKKKKKEEEKGEEEKNKCDGNKLEEWQQIKEGCIYTERLW